MIASQHNITCRVAEYKLKANKEHTQRKYRKICILRGMSLGEVRGAIAPSRTPLAPPLDRPIIKLCTLSLLQLSFPFIFSIRKGTYAIFLLFLLFILMFNFNDTNEILSLIYIYIYICTIFIHSIHPIVYCLFMRIKFTNLARY